MSIYNTERMHAVARMIKGNANSLQTAVDDFWSTYQRALDGTLPALETCLSEFMRVDKQPLTLLIQNRTDLGTKLDQAATSVNQIDDDLARHMVLLRLSHGKL